MIYRLAITTSRARCSSQTISSHRIFKAEPIAPGYAAECNQRVNASELAESIFLASKVHAADWQALPARPALNGCWTRCKRKCTSCDLNTTNEKVLEQDCKWASQLFQLLSIGERPKRTVNHSFHS